MQDNLKKDEQRNAEAQDQAGGMHARQPTWTSLCTRATGAAWGAWRTHSMALERPKDMKHCTEQRREGSVTSTVSSCHRRR
jgi:hypothetical protein